MRFDLRLTSPLLALLVAACSNVPDPGATSPGAGESIPMTMPPDMPGRAEPSPPPSGARPCVGGGLAFAHGDAIASGDSCNSCLCYDGNVICTTQICEPDLCSGADCGGAADAGAGTDAGVVVERAACEAAGQSFPDGSAVPSGDSCNTCICNDGNVACTASVCDPVFCAEFVEEPDDLCSRFPLDACIAQDPDCGESSSTGP